MGSDQSKSLIDIKKEISITDVDKYDWQVARKGIMQFYKEVLK